MDHGVSTANPKRYQIPRSCWSEGIVSAVNNLYVLGNHGYVSGASCYTLVFDVSRAGYRLWYVPAIAEVAVLLVGLVTELVGSVSAREERSTRIAIWLATSLIISLALLVITYQEYATLRDAVRSQSYVAVDGAIENFKTDAGDHGESFDVGSHHFEYAFSYLTNAYNKSRPHGGLLRDQMHVRIADVSGKIARLEVACSDFRAARP